MVENILRRSVRPEYNSYVPTKRPSADPAAQRKSFPEFPITFKNDTESNIEQILTLTHRWIIARPSRCLPRYELSLSLFVISTTGRMEVIETKFWQRP